MIYIVIISHMLMHPNIIKYGLILIIHYSVMSIIISSYIVFEFYRLLAQTQRGHLFPSRYKIWSVTSYLKDNV